MLRFIQIDCSFDLVTRNIGANLINFQLTNIDRRDNRLTRMLSQHLINSNSTYCVINDIVSPQLYNILKEYLKYIKPNYKYYYILRSRVQFIFFYNLIFDVDVRTYTFSKFARSDKLYSRRRNVEKSKSKKLE